MQPDKEEYCRNGHIRSEENTIWEKGSNGKARRRCRICRKISQAARSKERTGIDALNVLPIRLYSDLNPDELKVTQEFYSGLTMLEPNCRDKPELYSDYEEEQIPSPEYASRLCAYCPLAELCTREAAIMRHGWSVRGGEVYAYGHRYYGGTYDPEMEEENGNSSNE